MRIVREAAECRKTGGVGALLRREGLYSSSLKDWRREFESGDPSVLEPRRRGPKPRRTEERKEIDKLARENARLKKRLDLAEALLDLQKKTLAMLESLDLKEGGE
jgi:transposase-like protein